MNRPIVTVLALLIAFAALTLLAMHLYSPPAQDITPERLRAIGAVLREYPEAVHVLRAQCCDCPARAAAL